MKKKPAAKGKKTTRKKGKARKSASPSGSVAKYLLWALSAILAAILLYFSLRLILDNAFNIKARFGEIVYPTGEVRGIDISHYQEDIDWDRLRNAQINGVPVSFMIIKATEGSNIIDEYFNHNFFHARRNGIVRGAYHFFSTKSDPKRQAQFYCKIVQLEEGDMAPILDVEQLGSLTPRQLRQNVRTWMDYVERHYGVTPILYTSYKFRTDYLNTPDFDRYPLWIAHYYVERLRYQGQWTMWQHTDRGEIDGIKGNVDLNVLNGTHEDLKRLTIRDDEPTSEQEQ